MRGEAGSAAVIPAQAGIQSFRRSARDQRWSPAFAGVTMRLAWARSGWSPRCHPRASGDPVDPPQRPRPALDPRFRGGDNGVGLEGEDSLGGEGRYAVYIMTSRRNGTLYVGVTNDIARRAYEHRNGVGAAFTRKYGVTQLVWYEHYADVNQAIAREK